MVKAQKGFTLVEVVLYIAIMTTVLFSITSFLVLVIDARVKQTTQSSVNQEIMSALKLMIRTAERNSEIQTPVFGDTSAQLTISTASEATNPITFFLTGTTLMMQKGTDEPVPITSSNVEVQSFTATGVAGDATHTVIRLEIHARFSNPSNRAVLQYEQTFYGSIFLK